MGAHSIKHESCEIKKESSAIDSIDKKGGDNSGVLEHILCCTIFGMMLYFKHFVTGIAKVHVNLS